MLDALSAVGEVPVLELGDLHVDPVEEAGGQCLVVLLHLVRVDQLTDHLHIGIDHSELSFSVKVHVI